MKAVILCGGSGTRLWPLSRNRYPKQFYPFFKDGSLFQKTLKRNSGLTDQFLVIVNQDQAELAIEDANSFTVEWIFETAARNTAPAVALAAFSSSPEEILLVLPSDHLIENENEYAKVVKKAESLAKENFLVTFGIKPSYPEVGYGYIEHSGENVISFKEKPSLDKAKEYLASGKFSWNSGMFCFKAGVYLEELKKYRPDIFNKAQEAFSKMRKQPFKSMVDAQLMSAIPSESIDYAVFEKSQKIKVVPSDISWSDVGSYDALSEKIPSHAKKMYEVNSTNNFILSNKTVALIDVNQLIVVDTDDSLLIASKGSSQKVKDIIGKLQEDKRQDLLNYASESIQPYGKKVRIYTEEKIEVHKLFLKKNKSFSFQETFAQNISVINGTASIQIGESETLLEQGESLQIGANIYCKISNKQNGICEILETIFK